MATPPSPYREDKPLTDIIPPDRRRAKTAALVASSMLVGACLFALGTFALRELAKATVTTVPLPGPTPGHLAQRELRGPDGAMSVPPPGTLSVVHVWLQGCGDCMPAFEAMRDLQTQGGLGVAVPEINVAYGTADPAWAARYGVRGNLVFDPGGASVVRPLGIGTFTTLVIDDRGAVLHKDRPDREGYAERVRAVVRSHTSEAAPEPAAVTLDSAAVERVVRSHSPDIRRACWEDAARDRTSANITVSATVGTDGRLTATRATGDDAEVSRCIERQVQGWRFPSPSTPTSIQVPFHMVRQ